LSIFKISNRFSSGGSSSILILKKDIEQTAPRGRSQEIHNHILSLNTKNIIKGF